MEIVKVNNRIRLKNNVLGPQDYEYETVCGTEMFSLSEHEVLIKVMACGLAQHPIVVQQKFIKEADHLPFGFEISGVVAELGRSVTLVQSGDEVAGLVPLNNSCSGCAQWCVVSEYDVVRKPALVSHVDAACVIGDAVKAYMALYYQARVSFGETVVVCSAATGFGVLSLQLAQHLGCRVFVVGSTDEELLFLRNLNPPADSVIDVRSSKHGLIHSCSSETGGLGVDCIIDAGVKMFLEKFEDSTSATSGLPHKHEVVSSLAVGGRWVTSQIDLQLDPPDSEVLFLKSASIHYLFHQCWSLSRTAQGRFLHVLNSVMEKLCSNVFRSPIHHTVLLENAAEAAGLLKHGQIGKVVVKISHEEDIEK